MSVQTAIEERTEKLRVILDYSNNAIRSKRGLPASDLNGLPEAITTIPQGDATSLQTKSVTPTGKTFLVKPDSGYNGLSAVSVAGDTNLKAANIAEGVTIYGVTGTFEGNGGGSAIPEPYASYISEAEAVYTGEYANVIYAEGYGEHTGATYRTVMFLLDNWQISAYDAATTEYTHSGCYIVQKEDGGEWVLTDFSTTTADKHYAKNIKAASLYIEYNGMTLFPVGINSYPDTTAIDYSAWDSGSFVETLETGDTLEYGVEFADGKPNKITAPDGTVTWIEWGES